MRLGSQSLGVRRCDRIDTRSSRGSGGDCIRETDESDAGSSCFVGSLRLVVSCFVAVMLQGRSVVDDTAENDERGAALCSAWRRGLHGWDVEGHSSRRGSRQPGVPLQV